MFANEFTNYATNLEAKNLEYSLSNTHIPAKQPYLNSVIDKVESFANKNLCYEFDSFLYSLMIVNTNETFSCLNVYLVYLFIHCI